jgi:hypothetical protein
LHIEEKKIDGAGVQAGNRLAAILTFRDDPNIPVFGQAQSQELKL